MSEEKQEIANIGEWAGISDLFLIHIGFDGMQMLKMIHGWGGAPYREILKVIIIDGLTDLSEKSRE